MLTQGFIIYKIHNNQVFFKKIKKNQLTASPNIGITRIRNEELIISDTLNHMQNHVDSLIVFDDCSQDNTLKEVVKNEKVIEIIINLKWSQKRIYEETHHRSVLLNTCQKYNPEWIFYFDADERFIGDIKLELKSIDKTVDSIRIRLFDAYMTHDDYKAYQYGQNLLNFRKLFGPEYRDILMIWRNKDYIYYEGLDSREPVGCKNTITKFLCQHYGKAISIEEWEKTCEYYSTFFPEPYKSKWEKRKGKAIHNISDFDMPLYPWGSELFKNETNLLEL